jgi:twitching motility protein PilT
MAITPTLENAVAKAAQTGTPSFQTILDPILNLAIEKDASDIHFGEGEKAALRIAGKLLMIENLEPLTREQVESILQGLMKSDSGMKKLQAMLDLDFAYTHENGVTFRVNAFYQLGKLSVVMRVLPKYAPTLESLGVPEELKKLLTVRQGLIFTTGPAGSGKTTSLQAMLRYINENFVRHILTIENPIEHIFKPKRSIFTQREVGRDALSLIGALKSASRQDANVIMLGEIPNQDVFEEALTLAETGHLVLASLPSKDSTQAIRRILSFYSAEHREAIEDRLASALVAVLAQDLIPRSDQRGLTAVFELLIVNPAIRNLLRRGQIDQIRSAIQSGAAQGMIALDAFAYQLAEAGMISQTDAQSFAPLE